MRRSGLKRRVLPWKKKVHDTGYENGYLNLSCPLHQIFYILASLFLILFFSSQINADEDRFASARKKMVESNLKGRDITDPKVLEIMGRVERHRFVDKQLQDVAYADHPLPIDEGQTISQPYIVALMTQILKLKHGEKVLEIGTGSGYQAAVLSEITPNVYTIEIRKNLADKAEVRLKELGYGNVKAKAGDGYFGWEEYAPFDAVIVTCAANYIPPPLTKQLKEGGRLIIPLGSTTYYQTLTLITKIKGELDVQHITGVAFVPMVGEAEKRRER
ncbi:MAG: protein-L-isoaspartate(D-aspartate) O-methyltransferase [Nitrospinae bacterium]|nr:protein-L-isoaspartate(D-aspartate) O-methyltransferase [Nitrospinota bacterium]